MDPDARAFREALAATLRAEFAIAQLVPQRVAPDLGMNHQTLRRILAADRDATVHELIRISRVLEIPYVELITSAEDRRARRAREQALIQKRVDDELG